MTSHSLAHWATSYATQGLEIFPASPATKAPLVAGETADDKGGLYKATTDLETITFWWSKDPGALIAHRFPATQFGVDCDPRSGGLESLTLLEDTFGKLPRTRRHFSGGPDNGFHLTYHWPFPERAPNAGAFRSWFRSQGIDKPGLDLLHHTLRYTILPPSPHPDTGRPYRWDPQPHAIVEAPDWLVEILTEPDPDTPPTTPPVAASAPDRRDSPAQWFTDNTTWDELLAADGWTPNGDGTRWTRPGKNTRDGISATITNDCLFNYSETSGLPVTEGGHPHGLTRFAYYAHTRHRGDQSAAAAAVTRMGAYPDPNARVEAWLDRLDSRDVNPHGPAAADRPEPGDGALDSVDVVDFVNQDVPEYDWLIPGLIERGDRLIVTGGEGSGKSTLLRQIAAQAASGIHPFAWPADPYPPIVVLLVDLENTERQLLRRTKELPAVPAGHLWIASRTDGIDLTGRDDRWWLENEIAGRRPDLLITGPTYKMSDGDPLEELPAKAVSRYLDQLRVEYGLAVILEAHTPHLDVKGKSQKRPYGASLWKRWPEFGYWIGPTENDVAPFDPWRGDRDERGWPKYLRRDDPWPWSATAGDGPQVKFAAVIAATIDAGRKLSQRELVDATGFTKTSIQRAIVANQAQYDQLLKDLDA